MLGEFTYEKDKIINPVSAYQPPEPVREATLNVKKAYQDGRSVQDYPYKEFNGKSLLERDSLDKRAWLSWNPDIYGGDADWRFNGIRPFTRNKVISTAAHLTAQLIIPNAFAQNEFDEEDRAAANVMRDLIEYNIKRSNYETSFLFGVISGLVSPINFFKVDYVQSWQEIWQDDKREKVIDDLLSGFQSSLVACEDILFGNMYVYEWQAQDWIIEKGYVSEGTAQAECGSYDNFRYVKSGRKSILEEDGVFYDVEDINSDLVEKVVYKHRKKDVQLKFYGGIYIGSDNVDYNPFSHRTNKNKPKYNTVKYGYEPIDAMRFAGYKSLVAKLENDQEAIDREWQMYFDSSFLSTFPPTITMGAGKLDKSVISPATTTDIDVSAKIQPLDVARPNFALQALREAERSGNESSVDPQTQGMQQGPQKTAYETNKLDQNQQTNLSLAGKMIGVMVKEIGGLFVDNIIKFQSIGELSEITGEMTYKTFLLDGKVKGGNTKTSYIKFTDRFSGQEMTKEEKDMEEYKLMDEAGDNKIIYEVNPFAFSRMEYLITIDAERMLQRNADFERNFKLETYDRAIRNPLIARDLEAQEKITRDFLLEPLMGGEASKYLPNIQKVANSLIPPSPESSGGAEGGRTAMGGRMAQVA